METLHAGASSAPCNGVGVAVAERVKDDDAAAVQAQRIVARVIDEALAFLLEADRKLPSGAGGCRGGAAKSGAAVVQLVAQYAPLCLQPRHDDVVAVDQQHRQLLVRLIRQ